MVVGELVPGDTQPYHMPAETRPLIGMEMESACQTGMWRDRALKDLADGASTASHPVPTRRIGCDQVLEVGLEEAS